MKLEKLKTVYTEDRDCGASTKLPEFNEIKIKSVSNGLANYLVIETKRWALDEDSIDELAEELKRLLKQVSR